LLASWKQARSAAKPLLLLMLLGFQLLPLLLLLTCDLLCLTSLGNDLTMALYMASGSNSNAQKQDHQYHEGCFFLQDSELQHQSDPSIDRCCRPWKSITVSSVPAPFCR
jgi:hypothetical protein